MTLRLGLCCIFRQAPIRFRTTTAAAVGRLPGDDARRKLAEICQHNADALHAAIVYCHAAAIGCLRVTSQLLPLYTHPAAGYRLDDLPGGARIKQRLRECGRVAAELNVRTLFHPDQFVVLNSPRPEVVESSVAELEYQALVANWIGADTINIHAGGVYGDKAAALARLARTLVRLSPAARRRLTLENDDCSYTPVDLLPFCRVHRLPLVYDVHHHRCLPDGLDEEEATVAAATTWDREPIVHLSSPRNGWRGPRVQEHHDFIAAGDFPRCWLGRTMTIEVEAKAKELAIARLRRWLAKHGELD